MAVAVELRGVSKRYGAHVAIAPTTLHPKLAFGFSHEFLQRVEGWPGLRDHCHLPQTDVRGMQHELAYPALASGAV